MQRRGHLYELHTSSDQGRMTATRINEQIGGDIVNRYVFLCGPWPMIHALIEQLETLGVPEERIIVEDFNLV